MRNPRTLNDVRKDPRVREVSDERAYGNPIFVYLAKGWCDPDWDPVGWPDCDIISEEHVAKIIERMKYVMRSPNQH